MSSSSPAANPSPTRSVRFLWMLALIGGYGFAFKLMGISARQEKLFEDMMGGTSKLSAPTQFMFQWQRLMGDNFVYLILTGLIVLVWIGFAKSTRWIQIVVLTLTGFLAMQAIVSVAVPYPDLLKQIRTLSKSAKPE